MKTERIREENYYLYLLAKMKTHMTLLLLWLVVVVSLPAPSYQQIEFYEWMKKQPMTAADASKTADCAKKDAALSSAEKHMALNVISPLNTNDEDGLYLTIGKAIDNIPDGNTERYNIRLLPGTVYREKVFLSKSNPFVTISCDDPYNPAVIVWNDTAATLGKDGKPLGIDGSSTVTIESDYFIAYGVVFKNDAPPSKPWGAKNAEAPALRMLGTKATIYHSTIEGGQGTLYDQKGLHYYKSSTIKGIVDFIFGSAKSFYEDCRIISVNKNTINLPIKALLIREDIRVNPGESGFSFKTYTVEGEEGQQQIYLGREGSPAVYSYSKTDKFIWPLIYDSENNAQIPNISAKVQ